MDLSRPFASIAPGVESDVLVVLAGSTQQRSGRELARLTGRSPTGVQHVLDRLVEEGLVHRIEAGRAFLYSLNRDHLLAPAVEAMASARWRLIERLRDLIGSWSIPTLHASLFGSAARGEGNAASDLDVLVVRPRGIQAEESTWRDQLDGLADHVYRWTGNHAGIVELSEADLPDLSQDPPPVIKEVADQAVDLAGVPARQLVEGVR